MTSSIKPKVISVVLLPPGAKTDDDAWRGRRVHVDVVGVIAGLGDEFEVRQLLRSAQR